MPVGTDTRARFFGYVDQTTSLGLKIGIPVVGLTFVFLFVSAVTGKLQTLAGMDAAQRAEMTRVIEFAEQAMVYGFAVVVACLLVRLFREEVVGQALTLIGAALLFGSPPFFVSLLGVERMGGAASAKTVVDAFRAAGSICFVPGLVLLLRDAILRIWTGLSVRRIVESKVERDEERRKVTGFAKIYSKCWDMAFCRSFVRKVCPAFRQKKACWRIKVGCYCDEKTILNAMMSEGKENEFTRGIMRSLGIDDPESVRLASRVRRQRCRRCVIYSTHQQQKYQLLSPLVFPTVGIVLYVFHERLSSGLWFVLQKTDQVMSFLAYKTGTAAESFAQSGPVLTTLAFIWVSIIVLSYALRLLEYVVFDLQV